MAEQGYNAFMEPARANLDKMQHIRDLRQRQLADAERAVEAAQEMFMERRFQWLERSVAP